MSLAETTHHTPTRADRSTTQLQDAHQRGYYTGQRAYNGRHHSAHDSTLRTQPRSLSNPDRNDAARPK
jgi:hypothetical protein